MRGTLGLIIAGVGGALGLASLFARTKDEAREDERFASPSFTLEPRRPDRVDRPVTDSARAAVLEPVGRPLFGADAARDRPTVTLDELYQRHGDRHGVDWRLLKAVAIRESNEDPAAIGAAGERGIMQVLCVPNATGTCTARLNLPGWPDTERQLLDPDRNISRGAEILAWNIHFARGDIRQALAMYNGGMSPPPVSFSYAADVLAEYNRVIAAAGGAPRVV